MFFFVHTMVHRLSTGNGPPCTGRRPGLWTHSATMARMTEHEGWGAAPGTVGPARAASVADALARVAGRPVLVEAWVDGVALRAHRDAHGVTLVGEAPDPDAVVAAVESIDAGQVVLDLVAGADGVRFTDLLELDGTPWSGRPAVERLAQLAEVSPVAHMVERMAAEEPAWVEAFVDHVRTRGARGVSFRLAGAPRPDADAGDAGDAWQVVEF